MSYVTMFQSKKQILHKWKIKLKKELSFMNFKMKVREVLVKFTKEKTCRDLHSSFKMFPESLYFWEIQTITTI